MRLPTVIISLAVGAAMGLPGSSGNQLHSLGGLADRAPAAAAAFVVSESQFNQMFPKRNVFYTYEGLQKALEFYPAFANTGDDATKRREAAAFLANVYHESGGLVHIIDQNTANHAYYCDASQPYGCPAGRAAYYGRGPLQIAWNYNYKAAGDRLGIDLLHNPYRVEKDGAISWASALWIWNMRPGDGKITAHDAMVTQKGFGETIRSLNGNLECDGGNPEQRNERISLYKQFVAKLGVGIGPGNLSC